MAATMAPEPGREAERERSLIYKVVTVWFEVCEVQGPLKIKQTRPPPQCFSYFDRDFVLETLWSRLPRAGCY